MDTRRPSARRAADALARAAASYVKNANFDVTLLFLQGEKKGSTAKNAHVASGHVRAAGNTFLKQGLRHKHNSGS